MGFIKFRLDDLVVKLVCLFMGCIFESLYFFGLVFIMLDVFEIFDKFDRGFVIMVRVILCDSNYCVLGF